MQRSAEYQSRTNQYRAGPEEEDVWIAGIIKEIVVKEGDRVTAGQVLMRLDARLADADRKVLSEEISLKALQLRRIDAELKGTPMKRRPSDQAELYAQVEAQYRAHRQAYRDTLEGEKALLAKAQQDLNNFIAAIE